MDIVYFNKMVDELQTIMPFIKNEKNLNEQYLTMKVPTRLYQHQIRDINKVWEVDIVNIVRNAAYREFCEKFLNLYIEELTNAARKNVLSAEYDLDDMLERLCNGQHGNSRIYVTDNMLEKIKGFNDFKEIESDDCRESILFKHVGHYKNNPVYLLHNKGSVSFICSKPDCIQFYYFDEPIKYEEIQNDDNEYRENGCCDYLMNVDNDAYKYCALIK